MEALTSATNLDTFQICIKVCCVEAANRRELHFGYLVLSLVKHHSGVFIYAI